MIGVVGGYTITHSWGKGRRLRDENLVLAKYFNVLWDDYTRLIDENRELHRTIVQDIREGEEWKHGVDHDEE